MQSNWGFSGSVKIGSSEMRSRAMLASYSSVVSVTLHNLLTLRPSSSVGIFFAMKSRGSPFPLPHRLPGACSRSCFLPELLVSSTIFDTEHLSFRFGEKCQHLFLSSGMCPSKVAAFSQTGIQYCLNQLNSDIFPRLFASHESVCIWVSELQ